MRLLEYLGMAPTLPGFAARLIRALPEDERAMWSFDADTSALKRREGDMEINLQNMFLEYRSGGVFNRGDLVRKYADIATAQAREVPALWVAAMRNVFPVVRSEFAEVTLELKRRESGEAFEPLVLPLAGDLRVRLVYDFGNYVTYLSPEQLRTWGKAPADVLEHALANLGRLQRPTWIDSGRGFRQLHSSVSYGESMFLLESVVSALPFAADAVLMPCNRGILLAADGKSRAGVEAMLDEALRCLQQEPWPISSVMLSRGASGWELRDPPGGLEQKAHDVDVVNRAQNYAAQKDALDALHERTGRDVYVAGFRIVRREGGALSFCSWTRGVEALLPVADSVVLMRDLEGKDSLMVPWKDVAEICGARLRATIERPARFLVTSFPEEDEWRALSARAPSRD
jgi:hypothetical protein